MSLLRRALIAPIRFYQRFLSPMTPPSCRYTPTCSAYTVQAIEWYGLAGVWMGMKRISRCHPWHPGGHDPVPPPPHLLHDHAGCDHDHDHDHGPA